MSSPLIVSKGSGIAARWSRLSGSKRTRVWGVVIWIAITTLAFAQPLTRLAIYTMQSDLHSYVPLVPLVSAYLLYSRRPPISLSGPGSLMACAATTATGVATLATALAVQDVLSLNDFLGLVTVAYVLLTVAGGFLFLGSAWMRAALFPVAFLVFMVPLPDGVVTRLEAASVLASADVSAAFFKASGIPLLRDGTMFALPTITLRVAQECSGIHSSWVLLITSLIGSNVFLKATWRRLVLIAFVIPLGIIRNAFRILVIGWLCVYVGPEMIDSAVHRHGGPLFFLLSLVPLCGLLLWLAVQEQRR